MIEFSTPDFGQVAVSEEAIRDISTFFDITFDVALKRLESYRMIEMANAWHALEPKNPVEIRNYYAQVDFYIWQLTLWHHSLSYAPYLDAFKRGLRDCQGVVRNPRVLDYGSGIGTTAIAAGDAGCSVTIADIPGPTFEFAQHRLRRRGIRHDAIPIQDEVAHLNGAFDMLVCLDVLEHANRPDRVIKYLAEHLKEGALAVITAAFEGRDENHPHHLAENEAIFGQGRWAMELNRHGLDQVSENVFRKANSQRRFLRVLRYGLWRRTGLYIARIPLPSQPRDLV